jgi:excinuclease ABC subunit C
VGRVVLPEVRALPAGPGVYRFRDERGRALYLGRAADLRRRVASYWGDLRDRPHLRRMVPRIARAEAVWCDSEHEAAWLERTLLEAARPRWNRTTGVESTVYIGLHPRLEVRHDPGDGPVFGPYLGGEKVRLAVAGLERALGLTYAGGRLGGFDRDMARVLGVEPGSRDDLVAEAAAVLGRDRAAAQRVVKMLAEWRDRAAAALAYELAARIQAEIEALDWVTAEQKVAGSEPDADIHGWAPVIGPVRAEPAASATASPATDGVLVGFSLRGGRVRSWTQRRCAESVARARVASTPAAWRTFAERNAALAARLVQAAQPA